MIREARTSDAASIAPLAQFLPSFISPKTEEEIREELRKSEASFAGKARTLGEEKYTLVMEEKPSGKIIGTSTLVAQHGTKAVPHISLIVFKEERTSAVLGKTITHTCLQLKIDREGPTELAGLVLLPEYRSHPLRLGKQLSYARFILLKMHRGRFRDRLLAELMPVMDSDGSSPFWEAFGRPLTYLEHSEAEKLSLVDKEFIVSLFPKEKVYASLLPEEAQKVIGKTSSSEAQRMLERIGFRYAGEISPFNGAPHYTALTDEVPPVRLSAPYPYEEAEVESEKLFLVSSQEGRRFRSVAVPSVLRDQTLVIPKGTVEKLELRKVDTLWAVPLEI